MDKLVGTSDMKKIKDLKDRPLLLFVNSWSIRMVLERNEELNFRIRTFLKTSNKDLLCYNERIATSAGLGGK